MTRDLLLHRLSAELDIEVHGGITDEQLHWLLIGARDAFYTAGRADLAEIAGDLRRGMLVAGTTRAKRVGANGA